MISKARKLLLVVAAVTLTVFSWVACGIQIDESAHSAQTRLIRAIRRAYPRTASANPSRIEAVVLPGLKTLMPESEDYAALYEVKLHVYGSAYEIEARPISIASRAIAYSVFRDRGGGLHCELNTDATASSPGCP